jgi:hypothetical protein
VGVFDGTPVDSKESAIEKPPAEPDSKTGGDTKRRVQRVPQVFANPFGLKGDGKFITVDQALTTVLIKLTTDGKMEVITSSP